MKLQSTIAISILTMTAAGRLVLAELVVPIDSVASHVNVRFAPDAASEIVGRLQQGAGLRHVRTADGWHEVVLEGGGSGYIKAEWARVIDDDEFVETGNVVAEPDHESSATGANEVDAPPAGTVAAANTGSAEPADATGTKSPAEPAGEAVADTKSSVDSSDKAASGGAADENSAETVDTELADESAAVQGNVAESNDVGQLPDPDQPVDEAAAAEAPGIAEAMVEDVLESDIAEAPATVSVGLEGSVDYLVKFTAPTEGGSSQIFDNGRNVGIGTTEPQQRLEVNGNIQIHERNSNVAGLMITQSAGDTGYIMHNRASTLTIGAGSVDRITITRDGNVGFGVNRPSHPVEMASGAHVTSGGVWTNSSSIEKKENVHELTPDDALAALVALQPVRFNYKADRSEDYVGFIAEDVPDLVATRDRTGLSAMDIVAVLTRVVQEQQKKIDELEMRLANIPAGD